ncbi:hypothetical protein PAEH1_01535 [Paenalcaligenes hominis]|uniref:SH3b domain-containing protein n=1 Tax=Paenalcaligenes hominis TaxID=643674 RepID=A0A1U9JXT7_9BURK|nr:hypothetical protein PAEH1_01535 [Paenalcaligenes hominis]
MNQIYFFRTLVLSLFFLFIGLPSSHAQGLPDTSQIGQYATPKTRYVGPATLNVRIEPRTGAIVAKLERGTEVKVYDEANGWSLTSPNSQQWVSSEYLCTTPNCADNSRWFYVPQPKRSQPAARSQSRPTYSAGCPCSSGSNCYGPRGGRYCITSGGNKRYR